jgi:hypothetical protein
MDPNVDQKGVPDATGTIGGVSIPMVFPETEVIKPVR